MYMYPPNWIRSEATKTSLESTKEALNAVASKKGFRCVPVSWEDAQRGTVGGALSCWGGNISDVRLWAKDGTLLYTLRTENWNERLGYVASKDVAVVVGNHVPGGTEVNTPITLQSYLKNFNQYASYAGVTSERLWDETADQLLSVRFQAVFLPIQNDDERTEFCTEVYNYNTCSDDDPRNVTLLCTAQGTSVQQDGAGAKKVFIHSVDGGGEVHRYWLEAERSTHKVGGAQQEIEAEAVAAAARGKATAIHIGTKEMGTRFNVQMLIQVPLKQKPQRKTNSWMLCTSAAPGTSSNDDSDNGFSFGAVGGALSYPSKDSTNSWMYGASAPTGSYSSDDDSDPGCDLAYSAMSKPSAFAESSLYESLKATCMAVKYGCAAPSTFSFSNPMTMPYTEAPSTPKPVIGTSNAARVSRGTEHDVWAGVNNKTPERDPSQHATITVTLYYTVAGGVPSPADVEACIADLEALYKACPSDKQLVDCGEITAELTVKNTQDIQNKIKAQPYVPPQQKYVKSTFPVDED